MIAFHFPPLAGSSGIQRTLRFVQHLPTLGWQPAVLSAHPRVFERTSPDLDAEVPASVPVRRAFAFDTARDLAVRGRYPGLLARPDRWMSWRFDGIRQGLRLIREFRPEAIWSTYPIATAHVIGAELQRRSGLPWIADFRDPMAQDGYPADAKTWQSFRAIEERASRQACRLCFTTPSAAATYRQRYPAAAERMVVLENGFDEDSFAVAERALGEATPLNAGQITLLHSGTVYPSERDPTQLFAALAQLRQASPEIAAQLLVRFRASAHDALLHGLADRHGVQNMIEVLPPTGYGEALAEMMRADALLVLQASNCNEQVPAKVYEYLRAGRPILCLSDPLGDTHGVLRRAGITRQARLDDLSSIADLLHGFVVNGSRDLLASAEQVAAASRRARTSQLAELLSQCAAPGMRAADRPTP